MRALTLVVLMAAVPVSVEAAEAAAAAEVEEPGAAFPTVRDGLPLQIVALGGQRFDGAFVAIEGEALAISTREGLVELPLPIVVSVEVEGVEYSREAFLEGVHAWALMAKAQALSTPPPALVGASSVLWAGAGPAMLGDWDGFLAYTVLEASFIGAGAVMVWNEQYGPLLPLAALDLFLHIWAGTDAVREARRRRRRAKLATTLSLAPAGERSLGLGLAITIGPSGSGSAVSEGGLRSCDPHLSTALTGDCSLPY